MVTPQPITLNTTSLTYTLTSAGGTSYTAGNGLSLSGNQFSAVGTANRITVGGGTIDIDSTYIGQTSLTTLGTITAGEWRGTLVAGQYGGTGIANTGKTLTLSSTSNTVGGTNTGDVTLSGQGYLSISGQAITVGAVDLSGTNATGVLAAARFPLLGGDVTNTSLAPLSISIGNNKVTNGMLAQAPPFTIHGNNTSSTANILNLSASQTKTMLAITEGDVTNLTTDLAAKALKTTTITPSAPLTGGGDLSANRTIAIPQATSSVDGYLFHTDWLTFNSKLSSTRTLIMTPPLTISGGAGTSSDLSADRTIAMPPATNAANGYMTAVDHAAMAVNSEANATAVNQTWPAGITTLRQSAAFAAANVIKTLPAANSFAAGTVLTYIDALTTGNYGPLLTPAGSDTINGGTAGAGITPFIAGNTGPNGNKVARLETNGLSPGNWTLLGTGNIVAVQDSGNAHKSFIFDASLQQVDSVGTVIAAQGTSYTYKETAAADYDVQTNTHGVLTNANANGTFVKRLQSPTDIIPVTYDIGQLTVPPTNINGTTRTVDPADGTVDTVQILGTMAGPLTLTWPPASLYPAGTTMTLIDVSGTVSVSNKITVIPGTGTTDTFNGANQAIFDEAGGRKLFTSDGAGNWSVSITKTVVKPFQPITCTGGTCTVTADPNGGKLNAHLFLVAGPNNLVVPGAYDGMPVELVLVQPSTGDAILVLPTGSKTIGGTGIALTAANGAIDRLRGSYDGVFGAFLWDAPIADEKTSPPPAAPSGLSVGSAASTSLTLNWTDNSSSPQEDRFLILRSLSPTGTFPEVAQVPRNTTTYLDSNLSSSTTYYYKVQAQNTGGNSAATSSVSGATSSGAPTGDMEWHFNDNGTNPLGAGYVAATAGPGGLMSIPSWANVSGSNYAFPVIAGLASAAPVTVTPTGTLGATTSNYTYKVSAWAEAGDVTHNLQAAATAVTNNANLQGTGSTNVISWAAVTGADHYEIYCTNAPGSTRPNGTIQGRIGTVAAGTTTFIDTGANTTGVVTGTGVATNVYTTTATSPLTYGNQLSVSFWVKSTFAPSANSNIITTGTSDFIISNLATTNRLQVAMVGTSSTCTGYVTSTTGNLNDNNWHHVVVIADNSQTTTSPAVIGATVPLSTDTLRIWIDGVARSVTYTVATRTGPKIFDPGAPKIGSATFVGSIDDVRFYNRLLTLTPTNEISALYGGGSGQQ